MADRPDFRFGLMYDCRRTPDGSLSMTDVYDATIAQAELADSLGFDHVWFTEHHFLEDGYLPAFQPLAGAIAARTTRIRISTDIALLPLYHPIRLAEELAVLDHISHGRIELGIGMGYVPEEFAAFGVPLKNRVSMTEEGIDILRLAWADGPFSFHGKRYRLDDVDVHPKPVQPGGPPLWIAAMSTAGALRAARFGTNLLPQGKRAEVLDPWLEAAAGAASKRVGIIRSFYVSDDRERDWPMIRAAERFRMAVYERFMASTPDDYGWTEPGGIPQSAGHFLHGTGLVAPNVAAMVAANPPADRGLRRAVPGPALWTDQALAPRRHIRLHIGLRLFHGLGYHPNP